MPVQPLKNPPPAGNPWGPIEEARVRLGWSLRKLSSKAGGAETHYNQIATRGWNSDLDTIEKFIKALIAAGVPEAELRARAATLPAEVTSEMLNQAATRLIVQAKDESLSIQRVQFAVQFVASYNPPPSEGEARLRHSAETLVILAKALLEAEKTLRGGAPRGPIPGPVPPSPRDLRGTQYRKSRKVAGS